MFGNGGALGDACSVGFNPQSLGWWGHTILSALSGDSHEYPKKLNLPELEVLASNGTAIWSLRQPRSTPEVMVWLL